MTSIEKIQELESNGEIVNAISILENYTILNENFTIRLIFNYWYILIEPEFDYLNIDHNIIEVKLKTLFTNAYTQFKNSPKFIFFIGYLISLTDWYFNMPEKISLEFINKAIEKQPANLLFKWGLKMQKTANELENDEDYKILLNSLQHNINEYFSEKGLLENYFRNLIMQGVH